MKWWGYLHVSGTVHAKRYFSIKDLEEARESNFVARVSSTFEAENSIEALNELKRIF
jgi:hypothetical protein